VNPGFFRPSVAATLGFAVSRETPLQVRSDLQQVIANSSALPSKGAIRIAMDGGTVVLQGTVVDDHERRLAENLVRLTPGVHSVRNELQTRQGPSGGPRPTP
jgi:osmotically-inducible protein OsmY